VPLSSAAYTLPQLAKALGAPYRTLHSWVERDLLHPSVHRTSGTGRANLFDIDDALTACILADLREAGVNFDLLRQAADQLHQQRDDLREPMYLLVNGRVDIVSDADAVTAAIDRGGLTLAYNTGEALQRVRALADSSL